MTGQIMNYPLTTNVILEYGNSIYKDKKIISYLPNGERHEYTYRDMYKRTNKLANALVNKLGIKNADMVATLAWNHYQHIELYYAISGIGAICHTVNIRLSVQQIEYIINHSEDKVVFIDASLTPLLESIATKLTKVSKFIIINAPVNFETSLPNTIGYEELINDEYEIHNWPKINENDACAMCYTSGTTGDPKGALYSHRSTYLHALNILSPNAGNYSNKDKILLVVPQFHVMAWGFPYMCLMAGADMVLPSSKLKPDEIIEILVNEKVTKANGVPSIWSGVYYAMKKNPPKEKLALKEYLVGGSALTKSLMRSFDNDFGIKGVHAWGMTETSPLGTVSRLQNIHENFSYEEKLNIRAKQGIPFPGFEIRIALEDGNFADWDGETMGELEVKGSWVIDTYFKIENSDKFTEDGFFKTGDISTIDEKGYMEIKDRTKDLIKSGGEWISSIDLENALMAHQNILEAAVIAIPDEKWNERPLAIIVLKNVENKVSTDKLIAFLTPKFAKYQIPTKYKFIDALPKTSVGKFNKKEMRKLFLSGKL